MMPSAQEVEGAVLATLKRGQWARAVVLLAGAVRLPCLPTARTYTEVVAAVATRSTWEHTVRLLDLLHTSPLSARALYHTVVDAMLAVPCSGASDSLLAVFLAARRRGVALVARHYLQCSYLLLDTGHWRGVLAACSQERLVERAPILAHPTMLAAAKGQQWMAGLRIMTSLLVSGGTPSGSVTENFIRSFTPAAPWWKALTVASALTCSTETGVVQAVNDLRVEVNQSALTVKSMGTTHKTSQEAVSIVEGTPAMWTNDLTMEKAVETVSAMGECQWDRALLLLRAFPSLLILTPRPRVLRSPMLPHFIGERRYYHWELVLQAVLPPLPTTAPNTTVDDVLTVANSLFIYLHAKEGNSEDRVHERAEAVARVGCAVRAHLKARRMDLGGALEPSLLTSFVHTACVCGRWKEALWITERPVVVFNELVNSGVWEAALVVHGAMQASAQQRTAFKLEHLFISGGLWVPALQYAQRHLPGDTLVLRSLAIPLCAALGQWRRALWILLKYVPSPTETERLLRRRCILQHSEDIIRSACAENDWVRGFLVWKMVHQPSTGGRTARGDVEGEICMSSESVKQVAKLLLDHERYDECCMVVSLHAPTPSDPVLLRCLHLFNRIRCSPMLYGRILQQYKEAHASHRVIIYLYAVLALEVGGNRGGAFSALRDLTSWGNVGLSDEIARELDMVPQVKGKLPLVLSHAVGSSQAKDLEAVIVCLTPSVKALGDVNLFNEPLVKLVESGCSTLRECAQRLAVGLLRHMLPRELPVPYKVMHILAVGLESQPASSVAHLLYDATVRATVFQSPLCVVTNSQRGVGDNKCSAPLLFSSFLSEWEYEALFRQCAKAFIKGGQWGCALEALRRCKTIDADMLFHITLYLKEERACQERAVHRIMSEVDHHAASKTVKVGDSGAGIDINKRNSVDCVLMPGMQRRETEDMLMTLIHLRAWRAALTVFNNSSLVHHLCVGGVGQHYGGGRSCIVGALLTCVATSAAPWETTLQLLRVVQHGFLPGTTMDDRGLTDVLRCVGRRSGAMMCSRVLVHMVEEMGIAPTPAQYEVVLRSCLEPRLTAVVRDACAANLKRLSRFLSEKQIMDFVVAISMANISPDVWGGEVDHNNHNAGGVVHPFALDRIKMRSVVQRSLHTGDTQWIREERPALNAEEVQQLSRLAPLIVLATPRALEEISRNSFSGRFKPFDLRLLLQHYRAEVLAYVGDNSTTLVDSQLVAHSRGNKLLHVVLLPYEHEWRQVSPSLDEESHDSDCNRPTALKVLERVRWEVFHGFLSSRTMMAVWAECRPFVQRLAAQRWPWLCEYELMRDVRRREGRTPVSMITRPDASRSVISAYWATYGRIIWPELFFNSSELCQLAVYVPLVQPLLLERQRDRELCDLLADIQAAHFSPEVIPQREEFLRKPHSVDAIRAVFKLAFKMLKRLYTDLEKDARDRRCYYYYQPNPTVWQRHNQQEHLHPCEKQETVSVAPRSPRWSLALRILHHYRRSTAGVLQPRTLAALFAACATDVAEFKYNFSWWVLAVHCARSVEPAFNHGMWHHTMQLVSTVLPSGRRLTSTKASDAYSVEDIRDVALQSIIRVMLSYVEKKDGGYIPSTVSLLLLDRMRELLSGPLAHNTTTISTIDDGNGNKGGAKENEWYVNSSADDVIIVWTLMRSHCCMERLDSLHALLLRRLVLEGQPFNGLS